MRPFLHAILLFAAAAPRAFPDPPSAAGSGEISPFSATIEVTIVDLTVIVRDAHGKPVTGLGQRNFRVMSDGEPQEITNFLAVSPKEAAGGGPEGEGARPKAAAVPAETERVVLFFDNLHLRPGGRGRAVAALRGMAPLLARGSREVLVVASDRTVDLMGGFTASPDELRIRLGRLNERAASATERDRQRDRVREELNRLVKNAGSSARRQTSEDAMYQSAIQQVEAVGRTERDDVEHTLEALTSMVETLAGFEGRKALVYVGDGLTFHPAEELYSFLDQAFPMAGVRLSAMSLDESGLFRDLAASANDHGVTLYVVETSGLSGEGAASASRAATWDPLLRGGGTSASLASRVAAGLLADQTGGLALVGASDIEHGFDRLREDFESYYSLGFRPTSPEAQRHNVRVDVTGAGEAVEVRARRGYGSETAADRMTRAVLTRLRLPGTENPLGVRWNVGAGEAAPGGEVKVPVVLDVPWKSLTLVPAGGEDLVGEIEVQLAFMDAQGSVSEVRRLRQPLRLPERYLAAARKESYRYTVETFLKPGRWTMSMAVSDVGSRVTSYFVIDRRND